jgi:hypothetical protein
VGSTCTTTVVFKGCYNGNPPTATLNILAPNAANGTQTVPVGLAQGQGQCVPSISVSPSSVTFVPCPNDPRSGQSNCFLPPDPVPITVTNTGGGILQVGTVTVTGTDSQGRPESTFFKVTPNSGCGNISAGGQCTITVSFPRPEYFAETATLVIDSNALEGSQSVTLNWPQVPSLG